VCVCVCLCVYIGWCCC